jgi:hypothetical protein
MGCFLGVGTVHGDVDPDRREQQNSVQATRSVRCHEISGGGESRNNQSKL